MRLESNILIFYETQETLRAVSPSRRQPGSMACPTLVTYAILTPQPQKSRGATSEQCSKSLIVLVLLVYRDPSV